MGRPSNTGERRAQIVAGLLVVMAREGYERATIHAIGKAAGLTPGLVHYHFETKLDVLKELIGSLNASVDARYRARLAGARSAEERLFAFIDAHVALGEDADPRAVAAWNVVGAEAIREPAVRALYRKTLARGFTEMRKLVRAYLLAEGRKTSDARRIAASLVSAVEGAYRVAAASPKGLPQGYAAPLFRSMARALVQAQPLA